MATSNLASLEGRYRFLRGPGPWLWVVLVVGVCGRAFLVVATDGTDDVPIWQSHAGWTWEHGLVGYYEMMDVFNHPPFIGWVHSKVWEWSRAAGIPFRIPLRAPYALLDLGSALLLVHLFRASPWRWVIFAAYWLNPLTLIFSAYHGNTDSGVAFFMLLALSQAARPHAALAGLALGVGLWVKLPALLASPALFFFFKSWRERALFAAVFLGVGATTYVPVLLEAPGLLYVRVIAYPGLHIVTPGGVPVWGIWNVFGLTDALPALRGVARAHADHNSLVALLPIVLFAWLRRHEAGARALGVTVCGSLLLFHGLTTLWAWQYLAWLLPFLIFPGGWFFAAATLVIGAYIYTVYATLCGNLLLLGKWDFNGLPHWPIHLKLLRDAANLFCTGSGMALLLLAARREWLRWRSPGEPAP